MLGGVSEIKCKFLRRLVCSRTALDTLPAPAGPPWHNFNSISVFDQQKDNDKVKDKDKDIDKDKDKDKDKDCT